MFCRFTDHFHLEHPNWFETLKLEAICISLSGPPWKWKRWYLTWNILLELVELVGLSDYPYETLFRKSHSFSSQKRNASIIHPCLGSELYWRFIRCTKPRTLHTVMGSARRSNTCYPKTAQNIQKHPTTSHSMFNTTVGKNQDHEMHEAIFLTFEGWKSFNLLCKNQALSINFIFFTASLQGVRKLKDSISWNNSLWGGHCEGTDCANFLRSKFSRIPSQKIHMFSAIFSPRNSIRGWGATKSTKPDSASDVWVKSDLEAHFRCQLRLSSIFSEKKHHQFFWTTQKRTNFSPQSLARRPRHGNQKYCSAVPLPLHFVPMRCVASHQHRLEEWGATIRHPPNGQPSEQGRMSPAGFFSVPWECWMYQNTPKKALLGFYAGFLRLKSWWLKHSKTLFDFQLLHQYPRDFARKMDISFHFLDRGKDMSLTSVTGSLLWIAKWTQLAVFDDLWNNIAC